MKKVLSLSIVIFLLMPTFAGNYERLQKLRDCDKLIIKQKRKDDVTVVGQTQVRSLAQMLVMKIDSSNTQAGEPTYKVEFYRGSGRKPLDMVWVHSNGNWGLTGDNNPLGKDTKVVDWIKKALKR